MEVGHFLGDEAALLEILAQIGFRRDMIRVTKRQGGERKYD